MPRTAGQENTAVRTARLPQFFDHMCDPVRVRTAYKCRAYPDQAQQQMLARTFGCVRVVWNRTLAARRAREHDVIVIEDLNVFGMVRNRQLARVISDRRQLEYKCAPVRPPPGHHRPLVPLVHDLLGVRAPARGPEPVHRAGSSQDPVTAASQNVWTGG